MGIYYNGSKDALQASSLGSTPCISTKWACGLTAKILGFQPNDEGSIPSTLSITFKKTIRLVLSNGKEPWIGYVIPNFEIKYEAKDQL